MNTQSQKYAVTIEDEFGRHYPECFEPIYVSINDASTGKSVESRFLPEGIRTADEGGGWTKIQFRLAESEAKAIRARLAKRGLLA